MTKLKGHLVKGIIYDLDGTLASSTLNFKAMRETIGCPLGHDLLNFIESIVQLLIYYFALKDMTISFLEDDRYCCQE